MFLHYHCGGEKFEPEGRLGMKVNTTEAWGRQSEALKELVEELRKKLLEVEREISTTSDPLTLQGRMTCPCKANGGSSRCWHFDVCDSENSHCTVVDAGERLLKETLDNDNDITMFLMKVSNGDCKKWLEEFLLHWERMLETTASPTTGPATAQSRAPATTPITWILLVTLTCSLLLGILG
ncbi:UL16-binding protein 1-like [Diceros bicornis minor]|uniref:UL16-binding protein 1-like n=1 Tax=Diceros bicornis minor TaxID=77932 RepID=UPI0026E9D6BC|nr:UL16-binding protein 1-like [Diceros bicornis minor]